MHCNMCSEENPCPDCLVDEVSNRRIPRYATQGGGVVVPCEFGGYMFEEVPEWSNYEVGDIMPAEWDLIPLH